MKQIQFKNCIIEKTFYSYSRDMCVTHTHNLCGPLTNAEMFFFPWPGAEALNHSVLHLSSAMTNEESFTFTMLKKIIYTLLSLLQSSWKPCPFIRGFLFFFPHYFTICVAALWAKFGGRFPMRQSDSNSVPNGHMVSWFTTAVIKWLQL